MGQFSLLSAVMAIVVGVQPGGKGKFAVCFVYWSGQAPAVALRTRSFAGVNEVLDSILGVTGEWGALGAVAMAAPLSWSGTPHGWRPCDRQLLKQLPPWAPKTWLRAPNSLPGAISVQGPALIWAMAREAKRGQLPAHEVVETMPRLCLAQVAGDLEEAIVDYRRQEVAPARRREHVQRLLARLVDPGLVRIEDAPPRTPDELDALVCAVVALGIAAPDSGVVLSELPGGDIRPVGKRSVAILQAFP